MKNIIEISSKKPTLLEYYSEVLKNKYLIFQITKKEFITAYTQSLVGFLYHALVPLMQTIIFNFFINKIEFNPNDKIPSFLFVLIGVTIWNLFSANTIKISQIFLTNRKYLSKLYFYKFSLVISSILVTTTHFVINFLILLGTILFFKIKFENIQIDLDFKIFFIIIPIGLAAILSAGIGMIICSLSVRYRDLLFGVNFIFQLLIFVSPVLFSVNNMDGQFSTFLFLNPTTSFLEFFRWIFISDYQINMQYFMINVFCSVLLFLIGTKLYISAERKVADYL
jgi:lipopolysaccharide transport system permease protein